MAAYSYEGLKNLWIKNGGSPQWADTMAAVAMAESQGDPAAANASGATGVWQILSSAQSAAFNAQHPAHTMSDPNANARAAIALLGNGSGISNWTADPVGAAVVAAGSKPLTPQQAQQYATQGVPATLTSATTSTANTGAGQPSAAEIAQRMKTAYGYGSWATQNKELYPILIEAVKNGWDQNTFLGAVTATNWYKTTNEAQRDWQITQSTDPAKAQAELAQARDKVLAVEDTSGVQLSAAQVEQIAHKVASNSATQTGVLGSQAGYTQEQLEQDVVKAANLGKQTDNGANTDTLGGIAGQLLNQFKTVAQQYLMYDPSNPDKSLISDQSLMSQVQSAMQKYTGTGSFGSSNLINGSVADFTQQMIEQASRFYPSLAGSIAAGTKPQDYVQPLQRFVANTLGFGDNSAAINVLDPQWNWMIATPDPKTGQKTALTQDQILSKITDPNFAFTDPNGQKMTFDNTSTALNMANTVTNGLSSMFGVGGK